MQQLNYITLYINNTIFHLQIILFNNSHQLNRRVLTYLRVLPVYAHMLPWYLLSGEPDYFGRNKISSGGDLSHYSSASLY